MNTLLSKPTKDPDAFRPYLAGHPAPAGPQAFSRNADDDGVCWLTFDTPASSVNLWTESTLREFVWHLEQIEIDPTVRALVIRSAKERVFIAGADLHAIRGLTTPRLHQLIWLGQAAFDRLARLPMPKVAMIHGACAGGGFEMALACDWRIASDDPSTLIGLPETQLGILPGWGGCVRLPRLLGLRRALDIILNGKLHPAKAALKKGLVTHLAPRTAMKTLARRLTRENRPQLPTHLDNFPGLSRAVARIARQAVMKKTRGLYPAPLRAIDVASRALHLATEEGFALERHAILDLAASTEAARLMDLFFKREAANKHRPVKGVALSIRDAVVVGAGVMGSGIAQLLATRGVRTLMTDISPEALGNGLARIRSLTEKAASKHVLTTKQARQSMDRLSVSHERVPLTHHPLVIEAATEDLATKKKIFADLAARAAPDTILATNTSALSVAEIAKDLPSPERVVGLHFFNPVHQMPLVEVVVLPHTSTDVIATAVSFVQSLGKTPILVQDRPGFVVNRILVPYLLEAVRLHDQGVSATDIDTAMLDFGMPMGPLRLLDEIGLDVAQHVADTLGAAFPDRLPKLNTIRQMIQAGALGRKNGRGFYRYKDGDAIEEWRTGESRTTPAGTPTRESIQERLSALLSDEARRCLDDGVAASASDINLAMVLGTGYPPFRGGPLTTTE